MFTRRLPTLRRRTDQTPANSIWNLMEDFRDSPFSLTREDVVVPALEMKENDSEVTVRAELPGIDPKEVDVSLERGYLTIKGEKKQEKKQEKENYLHVETSYGSFSRTIPVPADIDPDKVRAGYKKGVLTITMPKKETAKPRRVEISGS